MLANENKKSIVSEYYVIVRMTSNQKMIKIALLGSGEVLMGLVEYLKTKSNIDKIVIGYSSRHGNEIIKGTVTFERFLLEIVNTSSKVEIIKMEDLDGEEWDRICDTDIQISLGSPWIFKTRHIEKAPMLIHSHCTDLPRYRGGASMTWMILSNERKSAITLFKMNERIDGGDLIIKEGFKFPRELNTPKQYMEYTNTRLLKTLRKYLDKMMCNEFNIEGKLTVQKEAESTYFPRISTRIHGWINWEWDGEDIVSFINAFGDPYEGAKTRITRNDDEILFIKKAKVIRNKRRFHPFINELIYRINEEKIYVACREKSIIIENYEVNSTTRKNSILLGDRLYCTKKDLDVALKSRVFFKPR